MPQSPSLACGKYEKDESVFNHTLEEIPFMLVVAIDQIRIYQTIEVTRKALAAIVSARWDSITAGS